MRGFTLSSEFKTLNKGAHQENTSRWETVKLTLLKMANRKKSSSGAGVTSNKPQCSKYDLILVLKDLEAETLWNIFFRMCTGN